MIRGIFGRLGNSSPGFETSILEQNTPRQVGLQIDAGLIFWISREIWLSGKEIPPCNTRHFQHMTWCNVACLSLSNTPALTWHCLNPSPAMLVPHMRAVKRTDPILNHGFFKVGIMASKLSLVAFRFGCDHIPEVFPGFCRLSDKRHCWTIFFFFPGSRTEKTSIHLGEPTNP